MSILSVDNISPIGSGTSVTVNSAATLVLNNANSTGVVTATTFVGNLTGNPTGTLQTAAQPNITSVGTLSGLTVSGTNVVATLRSTNNNYVMQMQGNNATDKVYFGTTSGNDFLLASGSGVTERLRIDSGGRFLKGLTGSGASRSSTSVRYPHFQVSSPWTSGLGSLKIECTDDYPIIFIDSNASYASGSGAGVITWSVKDSSGDYCNTASVRSQIDSTPSNDSAPGRLQFMTTTSGTTPTTKMTIDSGGSVSKPLNPAFYAYITTNNAVYSAGTIVPWEGTHIDTRSAFQTSGSDQGKFIVPTTGIYYFGWRLNRRDDSRFDIAIYQNGSVKYIDELRTDYGSSNWQAESGHYVLSCTAGQKVDLRIFHVTNAGSGQFDGGGNGYYDAFFGWMIG